MTQQIEIITPIKETGDSCCQTCGEQYKEQRGNFYLLKSPIFSGNGGYLRTCKKCIDNLYAQYLELFKGNEQKAMERICQICDIYYNKKIFAKVIEKNDDGNIIADYLNRIQLHPYTGKTYSDTIIEYKPDSVDLVNDMMEYGEMDSAQFKKAVGVWGFGFSPEQYITLNDMFDDWRSRVIIDGKTRETLVRELCIIKLQMNMALKDNNVGLYAKLMKTYQGTMKSANLQPIQEDASDKDAEKPLGVMIQMFENERPIDKCRPEWEDVDGIVKYIKVYFIGHLSAMLKIKNKYADLYAEEMAKYRAKNPTLQNADDEGVFEYLIWRR